MDKKRNNYSTIILSVNERTTAILIEDTIIIHLFKLMLIITVIRRASTNFKHNLHIYFLIAKFLAASRIKIILLLNSIHNFVLESRL